MFDKHRTTWTVSAALLAEREAREQAEKLAREFYKDVGDWAAKSNYEFGRANRAEADRDAAVARAERAERDVEKLTDDYRAALDDAKREYDRAEQAEKEASDLLRQRDEWANHAAQEGLRAESALAALRVIAGPADREPLMGVYRAAGGGYEGLQAVARHVLAEDDVPRAALGNDEGTSTPRCVSNPDRSCGSLSPGVAPVCRRCPNRKDRRGA